jgi:hypothetical protein
MHHITYLILTVLVAAFNKATPVPNSPSSLGACYDNAKNYLYLCRPKVSTFGMESCHYMAMAVYTSCRPLEVLKEYPSKGRLLLFFFEVERKIGQLHVKSQAHTQHGFEDVNLTEDSKIPSPSHHNSLHKSVEVKSEEQKDDWTVVDTNDMAKKSPARAARLRPKQKSIEKDEWILLETHKKV